MTPVSLRRQPAISTEAQIAELPYVLGGRAVQPRESIVVIAPDGSQIIISGMGLASAAEIQDLAYQALAKARDQARKNGGRVFNFDAAREREGLARKEEFLPLMRDAFAQRRALHLANPRTDPAPRPRLHTSEELKAIDNEIARLREAN